MNGSIQGGVPPAVSQPKVVERYVIALEAGGARRQPHHEANEKVAMTMYANACAFLREILLKVRGTAWR